MPLITATSSSVGSLWIYLYWIHYQRILCCQVVGRNPAPELTSAAFHVLVALASGQAHGYAVMRFVEQVTDGVVRLPPGTLYRIMARLVVEGLVEETEASHPEAPHDARRRYYRLTSAGRRVAREEAVALRRIVLAAEAAGLLPAERSA
jgi:DNA-binding PadR family transcriptional regulator